MNDSIEHLRQARQATLDRRIARMRARAARLHTEADVKQAEFNSHHGDIAYMTQPGGNESAFGRSRKRALNRYEKGLELRVEALDIHERADFLEQRGVAVKGDAERRREEQRVASDQLIGIGSRVFSPLYREGEVIRVNTKTYTIRFDSGFTCAQDKSWIKPL